MANLQLNVTANTARALSDFKKFSSTLDNKFLVSGLKLDVVRNALGQINREFQKSIGEQGLASAASLRSAQNQASLLTQTFKGFAAESALAINRDIGTALNSLAVRAGGTMKDVQKVISATPFISTRISTDLKDQLTKGMMAFQRDARRAGLGDNFAGIARQFLSGQAMGRDMINSDNPLAQFLGSEIMKRSGGQTTIYDPKARSEILAQIVGDKEVQKQLRDMAKQTYGYRIILEDLNTQLFNTEKGVFGALRKVIDRTGKSTTIFDEVYKLTDKVFGPNGAFRALFKSISEVFKIGDPLRPFIDAVQFVTKKFGELAKFFRSEGFLSFLGGVKDVFDRVVNIGKNIFEIFSKAINEVVSGGFSSAQIKEDIMGVGESVRQYIKSFGEKIRDWDESEATNLSGGIIGTLATEVGKTTVVVIKELLMTLIDKVPTIVTAILPEINKGINSILTEAFGTVGGKVVKFILGFVPGIGPLARASAVGDVTGGGGNIFSALAMGAGSLLGPAALFGIAKLGARFGTSRGRSQTYRGAMRRVAGAEERIGRDLFLDDDFSPVTNFVGRFRQYLSRERERRPAAPTFTGYTMPTDPPIAPHTRLGVINARSSVLAGIGPYTAPSSTLFQNRYGPINQQTSMFNLSGYRGSSVINRQTTMFKPLTDSELFDLYAKEAMDKINAKKEMENNQRRITADRAIRQRNRSLIKGFGDELYQQRGGQKSYLDLVNNANEINFPDNKIHGFSVADRVASSRYSKVLERYRRRYGLMGRLSRAIRRPGAGRWAAGSIASTFAINSLSQASDAAQGSGGGMGALGSLANGALQGAGMGMAFGPQGALIGAGIGAVFSAATLLMDKGIRDSIGKFLSDLGSGFARTAESFGKGIVGLFRGLIEGTINTIRSIPGVNGISGLLSSLSKFQLPHFNEGKNFAGPALGLEARMSGRRPMVVNDGEFVIPSNGFATLSTLVSQNIRSSQPAQGTAPAQISFYLNLNYQALTSNPDEIVKALKQPVIQIIDQAWKESQSAKILRPKNA